MDECDPSIGEIPENEVNVATRQINLANALGVNDWGGEIGQKNALVLSIQDSSGEDCESLLGCECMVSNDGVFPLNQIWRKQKKRN